MKIGALYWQEIALPYWLSVLASVTLPPLTSTESP